MEGRRDGGRGLGSVSKAALLFWGSIAALTPADGTEFVCALAAIRACQCRITVYARNFPGGQVVVTIPHTSPE